MKHPERDSGRIGLGNEIESAEVRASRMVPLGDFQHAKLDKTSSTATYPHSESKNIWIDDVLKRIRMLSVPMFVEEAGCISKSVSPSNQGPGSLLLWRR